jgi:hypothetical protein
MIFPPVPSPVLRDTKDGYEFVETSDDWNQRCQSLPCFAQIYWPGYATAVVRQRIGGVDAVIQLWKGYCPVFLAAQGVFPGGLGAEVGIYRSAPAEPGVHPQAVAAPRASRPTSTPPKTSLEPPFRLVPEMPAVAVHLVERVSRDIDRTLAGFRDPVSTPSTAGEVWYPAPELATKLWLKLVHPRSTGGGDLFDTPPGFRDRTGYWCNRWMEKESYERYQRAYATPSDPTQYVLHYTIDDVPQHPW